MHQSQARYWEMLPFTHSGIGRGGCNGEELGIKSGMNLVNADEVRERKEQKAVPGY